MRRKTVLVAVTALIACFLVGPATADAKLKKIKKRTTITLQVSITPPSAYAPNTPGAGTFSGKVICGGPKGCRANRPVTIFRNGVPIATVTTAGNGSYQTVVSGVGSGTYTASVPKKKVVKTKKNKKWICSAATSAPVVIP